MPGAIKPMRCAALAASAALAAFTAQQAVYAQSAPENISAEEAEGMIFERQQIMLQLESDAEALGEIVAGLRPPDKLAEVAQSIAQSAQDAANSFEQKVPGGRAKPEVWSNWADYSQRLEAFVSNADKMAKIAESGNVTGVIGMMTSALPCKQCHDVYREPKKKV